MFLYSCLLSVLKKKFKRYQIKNNSQPLQDINQIGNLWFIIKSSVYNNGKPYTHIQRTSLGNNKKNASHLKFKTVEKKIKLNQQMKKKKS